jgi:hypothetical protein
MFKSILALFENAGSAGSDHWAVIASLISAHSFHLDSLNSAMDHWDSQRPTRDQREPFLFNQVLEGCSKTHQYATRREFARSNNFPIFAGSDIANFVSYLDAHDLPSRAMFQKRLSVLVRP